MKLLTSISFPDPGLSLSSSSASKNISSLTSAWNTVRPKQTQHFQQINFSSSPEQQEMAAVYVPPSPDAASWGMYSVCTEERWSLTHYCLQAET